MCIKVSTRQEINLITIYYSIGKPASVHWPSQRLGHNAHRTCRTLRGCTKGFLL